MNIKAKFQRAGIDITDGPGKDVFSTKCPRGCCDFATFIIDEQKGCGVCRNCQTEFGKLQILEAFSLPEDFEATPTNRTFNPDSLRLWTVREILLQEFGEEEWLVGSLIPKQGLAALSGQPGDYKTWIALHIALCVSRGFPVFGQHPTEQGAVLVVDEETSLRHTKKRLNLLGVNVEDKIYYYSQSGIKIDNDELVTELLRVALKNGVKLMVFDSLVRVHNQDENDAVKMARVFHNFQKFSKEGISILFIHHHRKQMGFGNQNSGQSLRGSSDILAALDSHITVERKQDEEDLLVIKQTKLRQAEALKPFEVKVLKNEDGPTGFEFSGLHDEKKKKAEEAMEAIVNLLVDGTKSRPEIHDTLGQDLGKGAIDDGIKLGIGQGKIEKVPKGELPSTLTLQQRKSNYLRLVQLS